VAERIANGFLNEHFKKGVCMMHGSSRKWSEEESLNFLKELALSVYSHEALNNAFFDIWMSRRLSIDNVAVFARNYGEFNRSFPEVLSIMVSSTQNIAARTEYAKTLYSEMGYGDFSKVHSNLFDDFIASLGEQFGQRRKLLWPTLAQELPLLPSTTDLIEGQKRLYGGDEATGSGAQLALEWQAYTMQCQLYEGSRNYMGLWPSKDAFHESCEFFYAHIGAVEKEHKEESISAAVQFDVDEQSRERLIAGFNEQNRLFANFWNGIAAAFN